MNKNDEFDFNHEESEVLKEEAQENTTNISEEHSEEVPSPDLDEKDGINSDQMINMNDQMVDETKVDEPKIEEQVQTLSPEEMQPIKDEDYLSVSNDGDTDVSSDHIPASEPVARHSRESIHSVGSNNNKKGRFGTLVLSALAFGVIAGSTMVGVQLLSNTFNRNQTVTEETAPSETEEAGNTIKKSDENNTANTIDLTMGADIPSMVERVMPSVVAINNTMLYQDYSFFGGGQTYEVPSSGSGIIVGENDQELLIVTNNHVVEGSKELKVNFIDNTSIDAAIKGTDPVFDLAVIAVPLDQIPEETKNQISIAALGDSAALNVGETVVAIGNALGYGQSVTVGVVSALGREIQTDRETINNLLQTDAAINPGNSGGALLNMKGEVIGINAAKYSSTEVEGMGYAIPISEVQDIIGSLMNKKTRVEIDTEKQGYLGIQGKDITDTFANELGMPKGVFVFKIMEDGAAASSDLREKDIITKFDDQSVRTMTDLQQLLSYYQGGDTVNLTVQSQDNGSYVERVVEITLGYKPAENQ